MSELSVSDDHGRYLAKVVIFSEISKDQSALHRISQMMRRRSFDQGELIIRQGEPGQELFVLLRGNVAIYKKTPDGDSYKVIVLESTEHPSLGEGGLIGGEVRSASVVCETPVECLVLNQKDFAKYCDEFPNEALPIVKRIALSLMARLNQTSHDLMLLNSALMKEIRSS
jgi:CRP-like cAMP-binding protein